jgi:hypothetical protein
MKVGVTSVSSQFIPKQAAIALCIMVSWVKKTNKWAEKRYE